MKKQTLRTLHRSPDGVVPAYLSTDHILHHHNIANDEPLELLNPIPAEDITPSDFMVRDSIHRALEYQRADLFLQPIVTLPQRRTLFYEVFGRLRVQPGVYLDAKDYLKLATEDHILSELDTLLLSGVLKIIERQHRKMQNDVGYFINIRPFTLRNSVFMNNLLPLLSKHRAVAQTLIFEMHFSDFLTLSPAEQKILNGLHTIGCRFSVDNIHHLPSDIKYLNRRGVNFVKLDAKMIRSEGRGEVGFSNILTHKHNLEVNGIDIIAEKIESQDALLDILDYDIKYGQGYLFGKPDFQGVYT